MSTTQKSTFEDFRNIVDTVCREHASDYLISNYMDNGRRVDMRCSRLTEFINAFAPVKEKYGLRDGDRVLVLTASSADAFVSFATLACNHLTVAVADPNLPKNELDRLIEDVRLSAVFTDKKCFRMVESVPRIPVFEAWGMTNEFSLLKDAQGEQVKYEPTPDSVAIIFSSGTTSRMKPVEISYESLIMSAKRNYQVMDVEGKRSRLPFLMVFPMFHISGLACMAGMLINALSIATVENLNSASLVGSLKMFEPVQFGMVPKVLSIFIRKMEEELKKKHMYPMYRAFRHISAFFRTKLNIRSVGRVIMTPFRKALFGKNIYVMLCGGAPCTPELASAMLDLGLNFVINYSSTECGVPILESGTDINDCLDCVGSINSDPSVSIRINDPDANGIGEVYVKTRYIMNGYYNDPEMTAAAFDGEWFKTGDNGFIDKKGYLHIAGRSKDSIVLSSGKKAAPDDLENMLLPVIGIDASYSVVGVPDAAAGCDAIHIFIAGEYAEDEKASIIDRIGTWQRTEAKLYPIEEIHFIPDLPKTSIGKVKRVELRRMLTGQKDAAGQQPEKAAEPVRKKITADVFSAVKDIITRVADLKQPLNGNEDLIRDLGLDSLTVMEIIVEIENEFGVSVNITQKGRFTAAGISERIQNGGTDDTAAPERFNAFDFPKPRKPIHLRLFRMAGRLFSRRLDLEAEGLDNIKKGERYIFCPNHQTHVDGLWMWTALGDKCPPIDQFGCMAKMEHLNSPVTRIMLTVLGGIPVDRTGNAVDSYQRSVDFIRAGNSFLIHPEGTRTRDGKLGAFKTGAAHMAVETGVKLVPVAIDGGWEVWNHSMKSPKTRDPKTGKKRKVRIVFCEPIAPDAGSEEELTRMLKDAISGALEHDK
ncbi:MAG: AMP-binding protein [Lachnospiraceae bacterium]|nr:AMP-binding protein [Lachnospiraceae bacterium]